jgi:hypothetical protein
VGRRAGNASEKWIIDGEGIDAMMTTQRHILTGLSVWALGLTALAGCNDPFKPDTTDHSLEDCAASEEWILDSTGAYTQTPAVEMFKPLPHPTTECPFYRGGWQNFLLATQPVDSTGKPALVTSTYPTADDIFTPRNKPTSALSYLGDIKQAGLRETLIDQNGNTLYYSIEVNQAFADFIHQNGLETSKAIQAYPALEANPLTHKGLFFPPGVAEFKAAWQLVEGDQMAIDEATKDYISIKTTIPTLRQMPDGNGGKVLIEDRTAPIQGAVLRLLAIHVVFTLPGHPEFIWASFEHTSGPPDAGAADGHRNLAPTFDGDNPTEADPTNFKVTKPAAMSGDFLLYKDGTAVNASNASLTESTLNLVGQKFMDPISGMPQQTSIYRMFAASKSNTTRPDDAVTSLNHNMEQVFIKATNNNALPSYDKRGFYRLVGAQWMDKPEFFHVDFPIQNDASNPYAQDPGATVDGLPPGTSPIGLTAFTKAIQADGSDSPYSILAGEDRMSSVAMESFTQAPGNFNNCFTCHNTQAINANGVPTKRQSAGTNLLDPGLLNVSHVISNFILEDCGSNVVTDTATGQKTAVCN